MTRATVLGTLVLFTCFTLAPNLPAQWPEKIPVILDTDIGSDIDDAFALALILASPELDLRGVTTVERRHRRRGP